MKMVTMEQCIEAARLAYLEGHNDTVDSRFSDPLDVAEDLVRELLEDSPPVHSGPSELLQKAYEEVQYGDEDLALGRILEWAIAHEQEHGK